MRKVKCLLFVLIFALQNLNAQNEIPYHKSKGILETKLVKENTKFTEFDLIIDETDPATKLPLKVHAHYFQNKKEGKHPLLILVPPINGVSSREITVTHHFVDEGYSAVVVEPIKNIINAEIPLSDFDSNLLSFIGAVRSVIDVMSEKEEIESKNMFIWASSMGAIYSSIVIGEDKRVNAGIIMLGGGPVGDIVTDSKQAHVTRYREDRMKAEGLKTKEEFRKKMDENAKYDPLYYAKKRSSSDIFFVMSANDKSVPTKYQRLLYEAFGSPLHFKCYRKGHGKILIKTHYFGLSKYSTFTNSKLKE